MDTEHSADDLEPGQSPDPVRPPSAEAKSDLTPPSPRAGGTGESQSPAPAGLAYTSPPQQSQAPYGVPFQQGSAPPAGHVKPRRNWTPCYAAACLFLLLALAGAVGFAIWAGQHLGKGIFGSVFSLALRMEELQKEVSATPIESIKSSATVATVDEVRDKPADFTEQWLVLEGTLTSEPSTSEGSLSLGGASQSIEAMMYPVEAPVVILDISGNPVVAHTGDTVRAYGKGMLWDFSSISELPFVGPAIEEGIKNDPQLQGQTSVYFFIAKEVELAQAIPSGASGDEQDDGKNGAEQKDRGDTDSGDGGPDGDGVDLG